MINTKCAKNNLLNKHFIMISILVSLLNSFYYNSLTIMLLMVMIESVILIKCIIENKDIEFLCYYIIFLSTSMESATFVGTDIFYGFKNFKLGGINLGAIFIIVMFVKLILNGSIKYLLNIKGYLKKFVVGAFTITIMGVVMGFVTLLLNDNNIQVNILGLGMFIDACYIYIFVLIEIVVVSIIVNKYKYKSYFIKQCLIAIIISIAITLVFSLVFKNYGNRGGLPSLQVSNLIMLLICTILVPFYSEFNNKERIILIISTCTIFILGIIYNTNGKMVIVAIFVPIIIIVLIIKKRKFKSLMLLILFISLTIMITFNSNKEFSLESENYLFSTKVEQAVSMVSFWKSDWLKNMPESPKLRITQFFNITAEYYKKPWFFIQGKGYLGTIKDNLNLFEGIDEFSYSKWEIENETYYRLHETFNNLYLVNGLIGLLFFIIILRVLLMKFDKSPWLLVGGMWFILFYAYSITISIYGVSSLIIGLFDITYEKENL